MMESPNTDKRKRKKRKLVSWRIGLFSLILSAEGTVLFLRGATNQKCIFNNPSTCMTSIEKKVVVVVVLIAGGTP